MFGFFYNILATISGGRSFEQIRHFHLSKVQKTLSGSKFSAIDTQVFALLTQLKQGESFFAYLKRKKTLNALPNEDKQILINSEKKRLTKAEKDKKHMLEKYLNNHFGLNAVQESVGQVLNNKLSSADASIFEGLIERQEHESWLTHLKRSKQLYRLPVEEKLRLVQQVKHREAQAQSQKDAMLQKYLDPTAHEKIQTVSTESSQKVEHEISKKQNTGLGLGHDGFYRYQYFSLRYRSLGWTTLL